MKYKQKEVTVLKISIIWLFLVVIALGLIIAFFKNIIFATNKVESIEEEAVYEENQNALNIVEIMHKNTNSNKKMINEEREVSFKTEYEENPNIPRDEQQVKQEGKIGKIRVTAIQELVQDEIKNEEIIESVTIEEPQIQIIYKGTSDFLKKYNVHIEDTMYLLEADNMKKEAKEDSEILANIPRYLNVVLKEPGDEWIKILYNGQEGFLKTTYITSETITPLITEKNRLAKLKNNLNIDMDLSIQSGLTLSDYKTILSGNVNDKYKIFEQNAENFYNAEQKYKINGVFLASIGIHESAWGTSSIAKDKNNLFGYMAYDRDPYNSAKSFETYEDTINTVAEALSLNYLHTKGTKVSEDLIARGTYYNGTTAKAVNVRYATDKGWSDKVYNYMQYLYGKL